MRLRIAGAQMPVTASVRQNARTIENAIRLAAERNARILLTPEGSLSGYTPHFDPRETEEALEAVTGFARSLGIALALGTCFKEQDGKTYNQVKFFDSGGLYLGYHAKILRCGTVTGGLAGEILDYAEAPLRTFAVEGCTVGALICNDLWANPGCTPMPDPHLTQQLANLGAKVVFHAVNGGRNGSEWSEVNWSFHESNLRMRAKAGSLWIVTVDNCNPQILPCSAPSGVIGPDGAWRCRSPKRGEDLFVYDIDVEDAGPLTGSCESTESQGPSSRK